MTAEAGGDFAGFTVRGGARGGRRGARREQGLIRHSEPYTHTVPVQPPLGRAHRAAHLAAVVHAHGRAGRSPRSRPSRDGRVRIHPESQARRYLEWLEQHPPVVHLAPAVVGPPDPGLVPRGRGDLRRHRAAARATGWERDPDVLDTWFSSALWPFATLGWPEETPELRAFYPTDVLSTARDILFLWVARMVMMGLEFTGEVPFADVYVHSVIQAPDGRRMSKSLGTGIDPLDEIDAHGADAVRFGLLAMSSTQDVRYSSEKVRQGQALANKLFNASRFVLGNVVASTEPAPRPHDGRGPLDPRAPAGGQGAVRRERSPPSTSPRPRSASTTSSTASCATGTWSSTRAASTTHELSATMLHVLRETLAARAPGHPVRDRGAVVARARRRGLLAASGPPRPDDGLRDPDAEARVGAVIAAVTALRAWRDEAGVKPGQVLPGAPGRPRRRRRRSWRGWRAWTSTGDGEPTATVPVRGRRGRDPRRRARRPRRGGAQARRRARARCAARSRAPRPSWPTRASWPRRRAQLVAAEREKLDRLRRELEQL